MCDSDPSFIDIPSPAVVASGLFSIVWDCKAVFGALAVAGVGWLAVSWVMANLLTIVLLITIPAIVVGGGALAAAMAMRRWIVPQSATRAAPVAPLAMQRAIRGDRPAITASQRALPAPAVHQHIHFHGLSDETLATLCVELTTRGERTRTHARELPQ